MAHTTFSLSPLLHNNNAAWKEATDEDKKSYLDIAAQSQKEYKVKLAVWKKTRGTELKTKRQKASPALEEGDAADSAKQTAASASAGLKKPPGVDTDTPAVRGADELDTKPEATRAAPASAAQVPGALGGGVAAGPGVSDLLSGLATGNIGNFLQQHLD